MKHFLVLLAFIIVLPLWAEKEVEIGPGYSVVSIEKDKSIKKGKVLIEGNVKMFSSNLPFENVAVGTNSIQVKTDSLGNFSLLAEASDTLFYCFARSWSEVYVVHPDFMKSQHHVVIQAYLNRSNNMMRKPVLYLYSQKDLMVDIEVRPKGEFTFTYPEYSNGWTFEVSEKGILDPLTNKKYPYLFWEAETDDLFFEWSQSGIEGAIVATDSLIDYFEYVLTELGLNQTEKTDFITFWAPILSQKKYVFLQFLVDDAYTKNIAEMNMSPSPDAIRRVYLLASPLTNPQEIDIPIVPQNLSGFERNGFTVVEWGGTELKWNQLKL